MLMTGKEGWVNVNGSLALHFFGGDIARSFCHGLQRLKSRRDRIMSKYYYNMINSQSNNQDAQVEDEVVHCLGIPKQISLAIINQRPEGYHP